jgi:hypothetical protein
MDIYKAKAAFQKQSWDAKKRGIPMKFTFEEWCQWWEKQVGYHWQSSRGCKRGQYVMARYKDKGAYEPRNVRALLVEDNHREHNHYQPSPKGKHGRRFSKEVVTAIYLADEPYAKIAKRFRTTVHRVHRIKCRKCYRYWTCDLGDN